MSTATRELEAAREEIRRLSAVISSISDACIGTEFDDEAGELIVKLNAILADVEIDEPEEAS